MKTQELITVREKINAMYFSCVAEFTCCAFSDLLKTIITYVQDAVKIGKKKLQNSC